MMKFLILFFALIWSPPQDAIIKDIGLAMNAGSSKELVKFCNETVEIKIDGESSNYSKAQAEVILKDFFTKNPAKSFTYIHKGSASNGLTYTIGQYTHENGSFRVVMLIKKIDDSFRIDTLQFIKE